MRGDCSRSTRRRDAVRVRRNRCRVFARDAQGGPTAAQAALPGLAAAPGADPSRHAGDHGFRPPPGAAGDEPGAEPPRREKGRARFADELARPLVASSESAPELVAGAAALWPAKDFRSNVKTPAVLGPGRKRAAVTAKGLSVAAAPARDKAKDALAVTRAAEALVAAEDAAGGAHAADKLGRSLVTEWVRSYDAERSNFSSVALFAEVRLREARHATSAAFGGARPNRARGRVVRPAVQGHDQALRAVRGPRARAVRRGALVRVREPPRDGRAVAGRRPGRRPAAAAAAAAAARATRLRPSRRSRPRSSSKAPPYFALLADERRRADHLEEEL